ncbi:thermonuclease family protein [Halomonas sp. NO4]|uniref:thermonuclease family protein n=1 Tax=Halomonas sp. NO4 TaxID=2484813 RepID=UPI00196A1924|nr:thermonuclease family protein [Halomonas sp. NO4]
MKKTQVRTAIRLATRLIRRGRHNRMTLFWAVAAISLTAPWLLTDLGGSGAPWAGSTVAERLSCRVESIYDGDTMTVRCAGQEEKLRLHCIDAPEMGQQPWGRRSRDHLRRITPERVEIVARDRDRYGRLVGEVMAEGRSLNLAMVDAGQAAVYDRYCSDGRYPAVERQARQMGRGVWAEPGLQQRPWEWKK